MRTLIRVCTRPHALLILASAAWLAGAAPAARATQYFYATVLSGPNESPPNASPATGAAEVDLDDVANTMRVRVVFNGLLGTTTASHIHSATASPGTGTASVATTTPTFPAFPLGVTSGSYDQTFDMTQASSYNPSFVTAHGGSVAASESALFASIAAGTAYLNIHTTVVPGGEIRGFLTAFDPTPTATTTWGRIKALYR